MQPIGVLVCLEQDPLLHARRYVGICANQTRFSPASSSIAESDNVEKLIRPDAVSSEDIAAGLLRT